MVGAVDLRFIYIQQQVTPRDAPSIYHPEMLNMIADRWSHTLREMHLEGFDVDSAILLHLQRIHHLRALYIHGVAADAGSVVCALKALMRLESLVLDGRSVAFEFTITHLSDLCAHLPNLVFVDIPICPYNTPPISSTPRLAHGLRSILTLDPLVHLGRTDPILIAQHLDRMFPCMNTVRSHPRLFKSSEVWAEVQQRLFALQDIRRAARQGNGAMSSL
jgi:hypothetical protein